MKSLLPVILFSVLLLFVTNANSKERKQHKGSRTALDHSPGSGRVGFHATGSRAYFPSYQLVSFERFQSSYNTANASRIKSPLSNLRPDGGWMWGGGAHYTATGNDELNMRGAMYVSFVRYNMESVATATFKNGDAREMKVVMKPLNVNFDLLIGIGNRVDFGMALGLEIQKATLYSGYQYANGFMSYGTDQPLNGIFRFRGNTVMNLGARMDIHVIRQLHISLRGEYCGAFAGKQKDGESDYELLPHRDELYGQSSSGGVHSDGFSHLYLPESTANANNDYVYFVGQGANFAKTFRGWRFTAGLLLDLKTWSTN